MASLGALSYSLHRSLAAEHNGRERWGYSSSTALSLTQNTGDEAESAIGGNGPDWLRDGSSRATAAGSQEAGTGDGPGWLKLEAGTLDGISEVGKVAQVDPRRLCEFLLQECLSRGVVLHQPAKVVGITKDKEGILAGVIIQEGKGYEIEGERSSLALDPAFTKINCSPMHTCSHRSRSMDAFSLPLTLPAISAQDSSIRARRTLATRQITTLDTFSRISRMPRRLRCGYSRVFPRDLLKAGRGNIPCRIE